MPLYEHAAALTILKESHDAQIAAHNDDAHPDALETAWRLGVLLGYGLGYLDMYGTYDWSVNSDGSLSPKDPAMMGIYMATFALFVAFCGYEALLAIYHAALAVCHHGMYSFVGELSSNGLEKHCVVR